jgi:SpoVK/Ycf46/Vps4 family AAA+-type ATPase
MESLGMKKSISILLSGAAGTGKTENSYQLAKETDRPIFMVDISNIRDKWVGESEKNVKRIFNEYKASRVTSEITPILLINEADALLSKRITVERSVDQSFNAMQNIFLQAIEDFEGILVATTNLVGNLDSAFDRRFLFKIKFQTPNEEVRRQIWLSHFSQEQLAPILDKLSQIPLSGGEIANCVKRYQLELLLDRANGIESLLSLAEGETSVRKTNAIGFSK